MDNKADTKQRQHKIWMSEAEYAQLVSLAAKYGYARGSKPGLGRYLVARGLSEGTPALTEEDRAILRRLTWELRKVGTNVNQIAHQLNAEGHAPDAAVEESMNELRRVLAQLEEMQ